MNEAESIKSNPKNKYLEEENRLLDLNIKELASLNDNVHEMSVNLDNSLKFLQEYKLAIAKDTQEQAEKFGQTVLDKFLQRVQDKCNETERKISKANRYISMPYTVFYILIIILVALSSFFRQHHNSKCRDFTFHIDLGDRFMDCSDCRGWNYCNDTTF